MRKELRTGHPLTILCTGKDTPEVVTIINIHKDQKEQQPELGKDKVGLVPVFAIKT